MTLGGLGSLFLCGNYISSSPGMNGRSLSTTLNGYLCLMDVNLITANLDLSCSFLSPISELINDNDVEVGYLVLILFVVTDDLT